VYPQNPLSNERPKWRSREKKGSSTKPPHRAERARCKDLAYECGVWAAVSAWAKITAKKKFGRKGQGGRQNAMRHMLWQAALTYIVGWNSAYAWASAHEEGSPKNRDYYNDIYNNSVGRTIGLKAQNKFSGRWRPRIKNLVVGRVLAEISRGNYSRKRKP
jgi:hypothetical protein